jgi:hypothetical protein
LDDPGKIHVGGDHVLQSDPAPRRSARQYVRSGKYGLHPTGTILFKPYNDAVTDSEGIRRVTVFQSKSAGYAARDRLLAEIYFVPASG